MSDAPVTNWDLIHRWEWFRRAQWRPTFRQSILGPRGGMVRAFADLAKTVKAEVVLDCSCGLGRRTVCLAELGLNVVGSDGSDLAIAHARELSRLEGRDVTFFPSFWPELPKNAPHHFDAVYSDVLGKIPTWDALGAAFVGIFHVLRPGGFVMFNGLGAEAHPDDLKRRQTEEWESTPHETLDWFCRDGLTTCLRITQKQKAADYVDDRLLYAIDEGGQARLRTTTVRRPAYWNWKHWQDLTRMAGFCHLETREFPGLAPDGGALRLNVAWRAKEGGPKTDEDARNRPYQE